MKRSIDLTENRDFQKPSQLLRIFPYKKDILFKSINRPNSEADLKDNWGIFQGDSIDRLRKRMSQNYYEGNSCERCGKKFFPYNKTLILLCNNCNEDLEQSVSLPISFILGRR